MIKRFFDWKIETKFFEALSISVAKKYENIKRDPKIAKRIDDIFDNLAKMPGASVSRNGKRVYIPFTGIKGQNIKKSPTQVEVEDALKSSGYELSDYVSGTAVDKYNRTVRVNAALKKIKRDDLINKVNTDKTREATKGEYMLVFSKAAYDYAGQSTDRGWNSCKNVYHGGNKRYVKGEFENGSFICYITKTSDTNLNNPSGRLVFHPFVDISDANNITYVPDSVYGTTPNDFRDVASMLVDDAQPLKVGTKFTIDRGVFYCDLGHERTIISANAKKAMEDVERPKTKEVVREVLSILDIDESRCTINPDLTVDIEGNIDISNRNLVCIPVDFRKVTGHFMCSNNKLRSLEGAPISVNGFDCSHNNLSSLAYAPKEVRGPFLCSGNKAITSLEGCPDSVGGPFQCNDCSIKSLKGSPKNIGSFFDCSENNINSFIGAPEKVVEEFVCEYNTPPLTDEQKNWIMKNVKAAGYEF